ncbi:MAG: type IX secretion system outer membrane channel protein PorV [Bacteroidales bacterium]|nr:type IX secretion system outer membrane channel protein PorV [Bacteroidales bacterium]
MKKIWIIALLILSGNALVGQITGSGITGDAPSPIQTAVPFLLIAPDAASTGMGDAGAATAPDINSQHWNPGKYAFMEKAGGIALSYTPWLTNLIPDIHHVYLAGYYGAGEKSTISSSFRYFSRGTVMYMTGPTVGIEYHPIEFAVDAGYARKFTDHFSGGIVLRYIYSDIIFGQPTATGGETKPGTSIAGDIGLYYQDEIKIGGKDALWAAGLNLANIGMPVAYTEDAEKTPIPTNLRIGGRFLYHLHEDHSISLQVDANKLLVPTPPLYATDSATGDQYLVAGKESPESVFSGMFQSFYDAPGVLKDDESRSVFSGEIHEITLALGAEYRYRDRFVMRAGYFHEHDSKGVRRYITVGLGARFSFLGLDLSYLIPSDENSPLQNTFRVTLSAGFGNLSRT